MELINNEIDNRDPLVIKMRQKLDTEQQEIFLKSFYYYLNYHPTKDYLINLENVYKIIGFANKENAKRTLKNNFTKDEDYKILLVRRDERKNEGGFNKEDVMLNVDTFKNLCMIAKTHQGKEIRKYYIKMEEVMMEYTKEQFQIKDLEQKRLLEEKENELKLYKEKTYEEIQKTGYIYIVKTDGGYKVGKTKKDTNTRIKGMQTGNLNDIEVICEFATSNPDLLEKSVHYILDRYRCNSNREFFNCDVEYIKMVELDCNL